MIAGAGGSPAKIASRIADVANQALLEARDGKSRREAEVLDRWGPAIDLLETLTWLQANMRDRFTEEFLAPLLEEHQERGRGDEDG